jgi:formate--tetrahydrofolate ligase
MDMNDRQLRKIQSGLGGEKSGVPRDDGFDITVASEVMAIFCLAKNLDDLSMKLGNIIIGYNSDNKPVFARDLKAEGAMTALLKEAFNPNLVQTLEGTPALIHGGPFANIAHGCNSIVATQMGLTMADYVVTEAGFGADLGAEKFLDIKCRKGSFDPPKAIVLVATTKALKYNGGVPKDLVKEPDLEALEKGICNLKRHFGNLYSSGIPVVITLNKFNTDTDEEIDFIKNSFEGIPVIPCESFARGGEGAVDLARAVVEVINRSTVKEIYRPYHLWDTIPEKIEKLSKAIYRASDVEYSEQALSMIQKINDMGYGDLPICVAKTQYSFSDDPKLLGAPTGFTLKVNEIRLSAGAGFIVVICGKIMTMPGLPKRPAAENIYVDSDNKIVGLF